ncbi:MAG: IS200/IS605 family transposase [Bacteroidales bacterium]|nr:IS200/IS605 family transposase [Bacteroidales bacterium]MCF8403352.1 IS200/IS605 family transposase [Bacteroidales bacterium]
MSYVKIWIHTVWTTKDREEFLIKEVRKKVFTHIREYARENGICIDYINGFINHVHCLISLKADQCLSDVVNRIKGESSFWVNTNKLTTKKFGWQNKYYAESLSKQDINRVREYIKNQEEHHLKQSLQEELGAWVGT